MSPCPFKILKEKASFHSSFSKFAGFVMISWPSQLITTAGFFIPEIPKFFNEEAVKTLTVKIFSFFRAFEEISCFFEFERSVVLERIWDFKLSILFFIKFF